MNLFGYLFASKCRAGRRNSDVDKCRQTIYDV